MGRNDRTSSEHRGRIVVYRSEVLPLSETFITAQLRSMRRYEPHLVGLRRTTGPPPEGLSVHTLQNGKRNRIRELLFKYSGYAPSLMQTVKRLGPSMMHAHFAIDAAECLPLVQALKLPLVVTLHGWDVTTADEIFRETRGGRRFLSRRKQLQEYASVFLCVSTFIYQEALKRGFPSEKLRVHYIGIDTLRLTPDTTGSHEKRVLFVGRLTEKKGLSYLLQAMAMLRDACPEMKLLIIGDGPLRVDHEAEASQLNLKCEFMGAQPNEVVRDYMKRSYVLALPSIRAQSGDGEGLPTVIYEAFALGLPVVGFRSAGIPEAVSATSGLLATEGDSEELAAQLKLILENQVLRNHLSKGARQRVVAHFNLATQTQILEAIYDDVVARKQRPEICHPARPFAEAR